MKILITGATGNVGKAVIERMVADPGHHLLAAVRDPDRQHSWLREAGIGIVRFDFEDPASINEAFIQADCLFLMRPPQISDVTRIFGPLIELARENHISHIVFLSVQDADKQSVIPHHKIEKLIMGSGIPYTFIRPSYFMDNLVTTLRKDLLEKHRIFLPAGKAVFNWISARSIGLFIARVLSDAESHRNAAYTLTGTDNLNFREVAGMITRASGIPVDYVSPGLVRFIWVKRREGLNWGMILVMIMLHVLPRLKKDPVMADDFAEVTGTRPEKLSSFIDREVKPLLEKEGP